MNQLDLSVVVLLWPALPSQASSVSHSFTLKPYTASSSVFMVHIHIQRWIFPTCPVIKPLATIFKIFFIIFLFSSELHYHFHLCLKSSHKFLKAAIHIELGSFQNMSETKMQPWVAHPLFVRFLLFWRTNNWNLPLNFNLFSFCVITIIPCWLFILNFLFLMPTKGMGSAHKLRVPESYEQITTQSWEDLCNFLPFTLSRCHGLGMLLFSVVLQLKPSAAFSSPLFN